MAPPAVHEVLRTPGRPLDGETLSAFGPRYGYKFGDIRVHTDERAAVAANSVAATAFTVGSHIVFAAGRHQPSSGAGRAVLAHELAHVVQQSDADRAASPSPDLRIGPVDDPAERDAERVVARWNEPGDRPLHGIGPMPGTARTHSGPVLRRQPAPPTTTPAPAPVTAPTATAGMSRAAFEREMKRRFRVGDIHTGTFEEQADELNSTRGVQRPAGELRRDRWSSWAPGPNSTVYDGIVSSFEAFEATFGGWPPVTKIVFFETHYDPNSLGILTPEPNVGASYGSGHLRIYRAATTSRRALPFGRSVPSGSYPGGPVAGVTGVPGQSPGAPLGVPTAQESLERVITHELGHGLAEQAWRAMPDLWDLYHQQIGWYRGTGPGAAFELYDIQIPSVRSAFDRHTAPPTTFRPPGGTVDQPTMITPTDWNHPRWREQPLTHYAVSGGPGEDFAEAVMTYIVNRALLRSRSPARLAFLETYRDRWLPHLERRPPIGDFPIPDRIRGMA